jgi:hypothetical protein
VIYFTIMRDAKTIVDQDFLELRWRCLCLAADLDRIERAEAGPAMLKSDPRLLKLRQAIGVLLEDRTNRADQVLMIFSDMTPPPSR